MVWPGMVGFPDFSNPAVRQWWGDQYPKLLDQGVAGIWHDMCEPAVFAAGVDASLPLETRHDLEGRGGDHVEGRNLYGLGMAQSGHEALQRHRPDRRPWLLTRSGWAGVQRYAWTWTGDVATSWTMLHRTLATTLNLTMSGVPYTGPDIGGFSGDPIPGALHPLVPDVGVAAVLPVPLDRHPAVPRAVEGRRPPPRRDPGGDDLALPPAAVPLHPSLASQPRGSTRRSCRCGGRGRVGRDGSRPPGVDDEFLVGPHVLVAPVFAAGRHRAVRALPPGSWFDAGG